MEEDDLSLVLATTSCLESESSAEVRMLTRAVSLRRAVRDARVVPLVAPVDDSDVGEKCDQMRETSGLIVGKQEQTIAMFASIALHMDTVWPAHFLSSNRSVFSTATRRKTEVMQTLVT